MKALVITIVAIAIVLFGFILAKSVTEVVPTKEVNIPSATGHVNDYAEILKPETRLALENDLANFKPEVAVLTVKDMQGLSIEEFGIKVAEKWRVGDSKEDDGVILIVSTGDRKVRIEVGYGSEEKINDAKAGRILDESVVPKFKNGDWEGGILAGVKEIKAALQ